MKKGMKITLIVVASVIVLGVAALALALVLQLDLKGFNPTHYVKNEYRPEGQFTDIDIECGECTVRLLPSLDGEASVICNETERITHSVEIVDHALTIRRHDDRRWYERFGLSSERMQLLVYLPDTSYSALRVVTKSGDMLIPDFLTFDDASMHSSSGDISFSAQVNREIRAEASSGEVYIGWCVPQRLIASSSSGDLTLDSISSDAELSLNTSSGDIRLNGVQCRNLNADTSSGSVDLFDTICSGALNVETSSGSVTLDYCDGGSILVHTSSGSVSGVLLSQKDYRVSTSSGNVNVPQSGNGGVCEVRTSSGSVNLRQE